jgi:hypothetical protein
MGSPEKEKAVATVADRLPLKRSWTVLLLTGIEAVCVFTVTAAKAGVVLGAVAATISGWTLALHRDIIRIPILLLAIAGAGLNLYLVAQRRRLRNNPAAAWRRKPLSKGERFRTTLVVWLSVCTLVLAAAEIYFHRLFHHTIM